MRIPFTVIGGFLGAGKTTLLNHWLRNAGGQRLAVLVNDFGALNIDALLIEANHGDTIALSNGCVCCQIGDDLSLALMQVLDSGRHFDAVIVEASGVSDPWRVAQFGSADPRLQFDGVIVLVDASAALAQASDPLLADTLERQLKAADLIVLNKTDLAGEAQRTALRAWIRGVAGAVAQVETTQARVPLALLSGAHAHEAAAHALPSHAACAPGVHLHDDGEPVHGTQFESWSCRPQQLFDLQALRAWLSAPPAGVLRLKGVLRTTTHDKGSPTWAQVQFAGRHGSLRSTEPVKDGAAVVAIGLRGLLPTAALASFFDADSD